MSGTEDREVPMSVVDKNREGIPQASVDADLLTFSESLNHCKSSLRQETSRMDKSCVARLRHLQGTFLVEAAFAPEHDEGKDFDINNLNASLPGTATAKRAAVFAAASAGAQSDDVAATVVSAESQDTLSTATKDESCLSKLRTLRSQMDLHQNLVLQMVWHELSLRRKAEEQVSRSAESAPDLCRHGSEVGTQAAHCQRQSIVSCSFLSNTTRNLSKSRRQSMNNRAHGCAEILRRR